MGNAVGSNEKLFQSQISKNAVVIYSKSSCGYCAKARNLLDSEGIKYLSLDLDRTEGGMDLFKTVNAVTSSRFVPQIFICSQYIGGFDKLLNLYESGELKRKVNECSTKLTTSRYGI